MFTFGSSPDHASSRVTYFWSTHFAALLRVSKRNRFTTRNGLGFGGRHADYLLISGFWNSSFLSLGFLSVLMCQWTCGICTRTSTVRHSKVYLSVAWPKYVKLSSHIFQTSNVVLVHDQRVRASSQVTETEYRAQAKWPSAPLHTHVNTELVGRLRRRNKVFLFCIVGLSPLWPSFVEVTIVPLH